jgi:hypothetical protein
MKPFYALLWLPLLYFFAAILTEHRDYIKIYKRPWGRMVEYHKMYDIGDLQAALLISKNFGLHLETYSDMTFTQRV